MDNNEKLLRYSMQVGYLGLLLQEELLSEEEYEKCLSTLRKDYGIVSDILVDKQKMAKIFVGGSVHGK